MKIYYAFISALILSVSSAQASLTEKMNGFGFLPEKQNITLDRPITGLKGAPLSKLTLTSPKRSVGGNKLILDEKRSLVEINAKNINQLSPELILAIKKVVSNQSEALKINGVQYKKTGLNQFHIIGNFRASRFANSDAEWFIAIIPKDVNVEKISFQTEWFGTGAGAHNQIRMILDQPVVGIPQSSSVYTPFVFKRQKYNGYGDITYTLQSARVEATGVQKWSPLEGIMGEYGIALQLYDTQTLALSQVQRSVIDDLWIIDSQKARYPTDKADLKRKAKAIFNQALKDSYSEAETSIYNTIFASCVTYSLKALKAAFPNVDTTWFNPYSINKNVLKAIGNPQLLPEPAAVNRLYQPMAALYNLDVMTTEKIRDNNPKQTQLIDQLNEPLIQTVEFDNFLRKLALFVLEEDITYSQVQPLLAAMENPNVKLEDVLTQLNSSTSQQKKQKVIKSFVNELQLLWAESFPHLSIDHFFMALKGLQTQE